MSNRSSKVLKRKQKKADHEKYLKALFAKYGWGVNITSKREAVGTDYLNRGIVKGMVKEASEDKNA